MQTHKWDAFSTGTQAWKTSAVCISLLFLSDFFLPLFPLVSKTIPGLGGNAQEFLDTLVDEAKKLEGGLFLSVPAFCLSLCLPIYPSVHLSICPSM